MQRSRSFQFVAIAEESDSSATSCKSWLKLGLGSAGLILAAVALCSSLNASTSKTQAGRHFLKLWGCNCDCGWADGSACWHHCHGKKARARATATAVVVTPAVPPVPPYAKEEEIENDHFDAVIIAVFAGLIIVVALLAIVATNNAGLMSGMWRPQYQAPQIVTGVHNGHATHILARGATLGHAGGMATPSGGTLGHAGGMAVPTTVSGGQISHALGGATPVLAMQGSAPSVPSGALVVGSGSGTRGSVLSEPQDGRAFGGVPGVGGRGGDGVLGAGGRGGDGWGA